jgi:hypothetical protein
VKQSSHDIFHEYHLVFISIHHPIPSILHPLPSVLPYLFIIPYICPGTIFPLPFLHPSSLCQRVQVNITQNILLQDKNTEKYQLCYVLLYFSVSSKTHVLCEYKQKYVLLLPFVIIEVKVCTYVTE